MSNLKTNELLKVYVIEIADSEGNFEWIYTHPKPYYLTRKEARDILIELRLKEKTITSKNSKISKLWKETNQ